KLQRLFKETLVQSIIPQVEERIAAKYRSMYVAKLDERRKQRAEQGNSGSWVRPSYSESRQENDKPPLGFGTGEAMGKQDVVFAGGGEELDWTMSNMFDAMGAMSSKFNHIPEVASRAYDAARDGFVIAGGAATLVVEALDRAIARGAKIWGEITGYAANSDGFDMVAPSGEGATRCMKKAMETVKRAIGYINTHGTSTPVGDTRETGAIREVFGNSIPPFGSTKSLTGHSLGAVGAQELVYSLLMMKNRFLAASAHIEELDPEFADLPVLQKRMDDVDLRAFMSNSFGFGGTNASLVMEKYEG
ncbi:MAG: beta-ketoacyl synthase N-terminal-like domain-containing protein, partial [Pseudomonadota bacterium]